MFILFCICWYLLGSVSFLVGEWFIMNQISKSSIAKCIVAGLFGPVITIVAVVFIATDFPDNDTLYFKRRK